MKKALLLLVCCLGMVVGRAQNWAPIGAKWTYTQATFNNHYTTYTTFESISDTIISGQSCRTIEKIERSSPVTIDTSEFYMYSANNRVYFRNDTIWFLLYDFNAQAGDTFRLDWIHTSNGQRLLVTVLSVGVDIINGQARKTYDYMASDLVVEFTGTVIEGIGHTIDMFPTFENYMRGPLRCYQDNTLGIYKNQYYYGSAWSQDCDQIVTDITELPTAAATFSLSPNPATDQLNISIDETMVDAQLNIYNTTGALVQSTILQTTNTKLQTGNLPAGIYIAEIKTKDASVKKRWVKM